MPTSLISVSNKQGLKEFAQSLVAAGWDIVSTGGTFKFLHDAKIKNLKKVEEITGFAEIMDGRVKTLHPKIFGGILADRTKPNHLQQAKEQEIPLIDMVVCNLYPFQETLAKADVSQEEIIENIDIGGVSLLRAASKNYQSVLVVVDPQDYNRVIADLNKNNPELKKELAGKAFEHTAAYDRAIADYFSASQDLHLNFKKISNLRYGENPHQSASWYKEAGFSGPSITKAEILHGKELSYNNILDADAALSLILEFTKPTAAVIKHTNPCGTASAKNIDQAFTLAYQADSLSAFGGIIVLNRPCTVFIAEEINKVFAEIVIAPDYEAKALDILKQKKNIRLLKLPDIKAVKIAGVKDYKKILGGILEQDYDNSFLEAKNLKVVTKKQPTKEQLKDLLFACLVAKHVKSNTIVLVKNSVTVGVGAGQMSRVVSADIAFKKAGDKAKDSVAASDAFFPFRDSVDLLAKGGVKAIIQPGGSMHDQEVIDAADELGLAMVFTGIRSFKH